MGWPYAFLNLSHEDVEARRVLLDRYGLIAELLAVLPIVVMLAVRVAGWAVVQVRQRLSGERSETGSGNGIEYGMVPTSPSLKSQRQAAAGRGAWAVRRRWWWWRQQLQWWLSEDVVLPATGWRCGQRDQWVVGAAWTALLLGLCVAQTGRDYMHVTKRFGIVGAAQFPVQYVLGLKWVTAPLAFAFRTSHEQLNRWHRVLGAVVYGLLAVHSALYLNFFAQAAARAGDSGPGFGARLARPVVILGLLAITAMTLLSAAALPVVRRWSYRVFFVTHVLASLALPPLIFLHTHHARPYVTVALLLLLFDIAVRRHNTFSVDTAAVAAIPGTDLVRVSVPLPPDKLPPFRDHPGCHVYVSLPPPARSRGWLPYLLFEFLFNPFTVAAVSEEDDHRGRNHSLSLIVRTRRGPMTTLLAGRASRVAKPAAKREEVSDDEEVEDEDDDLGEDAPAIRPSASGGASSSFSSGSPDSPSSAPTGHLHVNIDGPYGSAAHFPDLSARNFDHILLVAGGVGATFVVPIYRAILQQQDNLPGPKAKVDLVWAVRGAGDATWAVASGQDGGRNILVDPSVHIFLTGDADGDPSASASIAHPSSSIELTALRGSSGSSGSSRSRQRPDFGRIVDDLFHRSVENRVAVIVCGPEAMVRDLRAAVSPWVKRGRSVWWHNESFGW